MSPQKQRKPAAKPPDPDPDPGLALWPGEQVLHWCHVQFATGLAPNVAGRRWFRDPAGNDIEPLLEQAGWPPRRVPKRPPGSRFPAWLYPVRTVAVGIWNIVAILLVIVSAIGSLFGSGDAVDLTIGSAPSKKYRDPAVESDDFPVMRAAPGSVAGRAPWQLDPDRSPENYAVLLFITSSRLLMTLVTSAPGRRPGYVGFLHNPRQVIWQVPREQVARPEPRRYSDGDGAGSQLGAR